MARFKDYIRSFVNLFFPELCVSCSRVLVGNEKNICTQCLGQFPQTNFWNQKDNPVEKAFWGRVKIQRAAAFLYFEKDNVVQKIIYHLKYKGKKEIGIQVGKLFGYKLLKTDFSRVDAIVPVPLHIKRLKERGYNQSEYIARGISLVIDKPVITESVKRVLPNKSQTKRGRYDRWLNAEGIFSCINPELLENKHLLIVDDIITTGATIESLIQEISKKTTAKFSIAVLASA